MRLSHGLTLTLLTILPLTSLHAADAKWVHATSAHFDLYTSESDSDAKAALQHLEATRAYFLAATHTHDPGGQTVRVVAFHAESDYSKYKPVEVRSGRAYGIASGTAPATVRWYANTPNWLWTIRSPRFPTGIGQASRRFIPQ